MDNNDNTALMFAAREGHLTPALARAFADEFIRLGIPFEKILEEIVDSESNKTVAVLVYVFLEKIETEPGQVVDFIKKHVGKKLQEWVDNGVEGADVLVSRIVSYLRKENKTVQDVTSYSEIMGF